MDLSLSNHHDERTAISITLLHPAATEYSEAVEYDNRFELSPTTSEKPVEDVAPDRPYIVRVKTDFGLSGHYHYKPDCHESGWPEPGVAVTVTAESGLQFAQSKCSSNGLFLYVERSSAT